MYRKSVCVVTAALLLSLAGTTFAQIGPPGWWAQRVGDGVDGSVTIKGKTIEIKGDGHDIWDSADGFQYMYKKLTGDGTIVARVMSVGTGSNTWAKGGVMIRQDNTGPSQHAMMILTGSSGNGANFQWRPTRAAGSANADPSSTIAPPYWVKLERSGNSFKGSVSPDGTTWTRVGSDTTVAMTDPVLVGLCVTSHAGGELRTMTFDNVTMTGNITDRPAFLKAWMPDPADGTIGVVLPLFRWSAGETAVFHNVYFGTAPDLTEANLVASRSFMALYYHAPGLVPSTTYYWRVDEVEAGGTIHTGDVWHFMSEPLKAYLPNPADGTVGVLPGLTLSWSAGKAAIGQHVYFGSDLNAVANGDAATDQGTITELTFKTPALRASTTYYWRVDTVKSDGTEPGNVWSFTTSDAGPANKILWEWWSDVYGTALSGLIGDVNYPSNPSGRQYVDEFASAVDWADNYGQRLYGWLKPPESGDYTFWIAGDDEQQLWLSPDTNPANVEQIATVPGWTPAFDWDNTGGGVGGASQMSAPVSLQAGQKYFIMALGKEGGGGDSTAVAWQGPGIASRVVIRAQYVDMVALPPLQAFGPIPGKGAVDVVQAPVLTWGAGEKATKHNVYFGDDANAVAAADSSSSLFRGSQSDTSYDAGSLEWGKTYYWRIDETDGTEVWKGSLWSFTTANFLPVDDFESYNDDEGTGTRIYETWIDGYTDGLSGSTVGNLDPPFAERTIVHGGKQSMPLDYNNVNSPFFSEAYREFSPLMNWTVQGVTDLSLWVRGAPAPIAPVAEVGGKMTVSGEGVDIWGAADQFTFVYKTLAGDGSLIARVASVGTGSNRWAKGGVMVRDSLAAGAASAQMILTGGDGNGAAFQNRASTDLDMAANDSTSSSTAATAVAPPYYVKIERMGDTLAGYLSADGKTWTQQGTSQYIAMEAPALIGICVTSHAAGEYRMFEFDNIKATGASGAWQTVEVGLTRNSQQPLYVRVEDSAGKKATVFDPNAAAVNATVWTEWKIPLSDLSDVNLTKVKKLYIGVGDKDNPAPDGYGRILVDDIRVTKPEAAQP